MIPSIPGPGRWSGIFRSASQTHGVPYIIPRNADTFQTHGRHVPDTFQTLSRHSPDTLQTHSGKLPVSPHIAYHPDTDHSQILNSDQGCLHGSYSLRKDMPQASGTLPAIRTHCRYTSDTLQTHFRHISSSLTPISLPLPARTQNRHKSSRLDRGAL
jgi:hypothetical protein